MAHLGPRLQIKRGVLKELGLDCNKFIISLIGGISGYKRPRLVLEIAKYLTEYTEIIFLIIGDGDEIPSLKNEIRKAKLAKYQICKIYFKYWRFNQLV